MASARIIFVVVHYVGKVNGRQSWSRTFFKYRTRGEAEQKADEFMKAKPGVRYAVRKVTRR